MALTDPKIKQAKPKEKDYKLTDEKGLYLLIKKNGKKYWRLKYRFLKKEKTLSIGVYPEISLKAARDHREEARSKIKDGIDPSAEKQQLKKEQLKEQDFSFQNIANEWYGNIKVKWSERHSDRVRNILDKEIFPEFGRKHIAKVTAPDVLAAIRKVESREAFETAQKARRIVGQVLKYGIASGLCEFDVSSSISGAMQTTITKHMASITDPKSLGKLLASFDHFNGTSTVHAALRLSPILFQRPGELRHMEWVEINWEESRWEIPANKMKKRVDHVVPLATQAIEILKAQQELTGRGKYVFPSARGGSRPMSENAVRTALRDLGFGNDVITPHGFRATARTLLDETLGYRVDWIEQQLAHMVKDANGRAYNRTKHLEGRSEMMQRWADYLDELKEQANSKNVVTADFRGTA